MSTRRQPTPFRRAERRAQGLPATVRDRRVLSEIERRITRALPPVEDDRKPKR